MKKLHVIHGEGKKPVHGCGTCSHATNRIAHYEYWRCDVFGTYATFVRMKQGTTHCAGYEPLASKKRPTEAELEARLAPSAACAVEVRPRGGWLRRLFRFIWRWHTERGKFS